MPQSKGGTHRFGAPLLLPEARSTLVSGRFLRDSRRERGRPCRYFTLTVSVAVFVRALKFVVPLACIRTLIL